MTRAFLLLVLFPLGVFAAPPDVKFEQPEVKAELYSFVVLKPEVKDGKGATKYLLPKGGGLSTLPSNLLADPSALVLIPNREGTYEIGAYAGNGDGASDIAWVKVVVGSGQGPIIVPPPVKPPDPGTPPETGGKFFFILARDNGPVAAEVAACVRLSAWADLRKDGHQMKDYPFAELPKGVAKPANLPSLVVLRVSADGKSSSVVKEVPLPTTDESVKELVK